MKEDIEKIYNDNISNFKKVKDEALFVIENMLQKCEIKIHSIQSRIKEVDSLTKNPKVSK